MKCEYNRYCNEDKPECNGLFNNCLVYQTIMDVNRYSNLCEKYKNCPAYDADKCNRDFKDNCGLVNLIK